MKDRHEHPHLLCSGLGTMVEAHNVKEEREASSRRSRRTITYLHASSFARICNCLGTLGLVPDSIESMGQSGKSHGIAQHFLQPAIEWLIKSVIVNKGRVSSQFD